MPGGADLRAQLQAALGGAYAIERELGGGGMSRVFLATETGLTRSVVVKILTPELAAEVSAERFAREVKLAARLQQANIVPLLNAGQANGLPWYSMPYVRGESLRAKLSSGAPVPVTDAVHILRDVARALAFAHGEGVAHRDIKPENILISGGAAVVTDFGIAKALTTARTQDGGDASPTITQMGASIGTPAYMAPEQIAGDPNVDHRADLYAWGVVAWELLGGKHPFAGKANAQGVLAAHLTETPAALTSARPELPPALSALVSRCLEKDPARRPQSANELLTLLDQITVTSGARPVMAAPTRIPIRSLVIGAMALVVIGAGAWLVTHRSTAAASDGSVGKSLAVLPFTSVGSDTANEYFAEGIADELTTELAKVSGLRLAATSSAAAYRNKTADTREVGKALNVATVLQGTVRREGARMRVTAQLSNTSNGMLLWSNSYEREAKDVFAVQDELTRDIISALRVTLAGGATAPKPIKDATDIETYDLYLRGLHFLRQRGSGVMGSIPYFRQALARDSTYARAWSELGEAYCVLPLYSPVPADSLLPFGRAAIAKAHILDPTDANAFAIEGFCDILVSQFRDAETAFTRALALDSSNVIANRIAWSALLATGRTDEAVAAEQRALRFDPQSATTAWLAAQVMLIAKRYDEGVVLARRSVELDSGAAPGRLMYALVLLKSGKTDEARKLLSGFSATTPQTLPWKGYLLAATGDRTGAANLIRELDAQRGRNSFVNLGQAWTYLGGGDTTRALDALERAARAHEPIGFSAMFSMPEYDAVRQSTRFAAVIKAYGLEPATFGVGAAPR
jgi:eukaryotic-like serine/threonine-protein kinase